jgi:hypothetical protein
MQDEARNTDYDGEVRLVRFVQGPDYSRARAPAASGRTDPWSDRTNPELELSVSEEHDTCHGLLWCTILASLDTVCGGST